MKIVHITTMDFGGAGLAVLRIHEALLSLGVNSKVLVLTKINNSEQVVSFLPKSKNKYVQGLFNRIERIKRRWWESRNPVVRQIKEIRINEDCFFSLPISPYKVENHPLVRNADVIHLHWVHNFINYPTFFSTIKNPCVWTFHDENVRFGGFHYSKDRQKLYEKYKTLEDYAVNVKRESLIRKQNMRLVPLSNMMKQYIDQVDYCMDYGKSIVHNPVNCTVYSIYDKNFARLELRLPQDKKIILFVAYDIFDKNKGLERLISAIEILSRTDVVLCCVGGATVERTISIPNIRLGYVNEEIILNKVYSAANLFVLASDQEAFAQTPLESIASGTPVVATPCSGTEELINEKNGIRCNDFTSEELARCIDIALSTSYDSHAMRDDIIKRFSPEHIAQQYIDIYQDMLK